MKAANDVASVAGMLAKRMAERLRLYRACVARMARGEPLSSEETEELRRAMHSLGLPSFAFRRDVRVWATSGTANAYRRAELEVFHPQLFVPVEEWVEDRVRVIAGRGGRPCPR